MVNFIGIGAQRAATSWIYSCMYEHPEICAPEKEIHFFSRARYEEKGIGWYKNIFDTRCKSDKIKGEFSTSYLYGEKVAERIFEHFPDVKILVSLRNPAERAASQYALHAKVGWLNPKEVSFAEFLKTEASAKEQGLYFEQLKRYFDRFPKEQIHVMLKERIDIEPEIVLKELFSFLGVCKDFTPSFLHQPVNTDSTPKHVWVDRTIQHVSNFLYKNGLDKLVFTIKKTGFPEAIRNFNSAGELDALTPVIAKELQRYFADDVRKVEELTGVQVSKYWNHYQSGD